MKKITLSRQIKTCYFLVGIFFLFFLSSCKAFNNDCDDPTQLNVIYLYLKDGNSPLYSSDSLKTNKYNFNVNKLFILDEKGDKIRVQIGQSIIDKEYTFSISLIENYKDDWQKLYSSGLTKTFYINNVVKNTGTIDVDTLNVFIQAKRTDCSDLLEKGEFRFNGKTIDTANYQAVLKLIK